MLTLYVDFRILNSPIFHYDSWMENLVVVRDLVKEYGGRVRVLDGISFVIERHEFAAVYGKSGSGKTTLLNILGGLDRPTSGEITIDGMNTGRMSNEELSSFRLSRIGFVFQDYNLFPELTVGENIELPLKLQKRKNGERVRALMDMFNLSSIRSETGNRISGGEAQRVAVARALVHEPKLILADEPTGNLDDENSRVVFEMLGEARRELGSTVVIATHSKAPWLNPTKTILLEPSRCKTSEN